MTDCCEEYHKGHQGKPLIFQGDGRLLASKIPDTLFREFPDLQA
jgi:hypothetical protein